MNVPFLEIASNSNETDLNIRVQTAIQEINSDQPELKSYLEVLFAEYGEIPLISAVIVYDSFKRALDND
jgi:hypothetical protein